MKQKGESVAKGLVGWWGDSKAEWESEDEGKGESESEREGIKRHLAREGSGREYAELEKTTPFRSQHRSDSPVCFLFTVNAKLDSGLVVMDGIWAGLYLNLSPTNDPALSI